MREKLRVTLNCSVTMDTLERSFFYYYYLQPTKGTFWKPGGVFGDLELAFVIVS